ncbi:MAG: DUF4388 domain-containing protein [Vicinamibacteria bacterium]
MLASFQGLIGYVEVPDLLTFVNLGRRTGVTELTRAGQMTRVFFQKGNPVFATSDKEGLRLGDLLLRLGRISRKDLDRCLARHRVGGPHIGQVFVSEGLVTLEELSSHLKVQVSEVIFETFSWTQGSFAFYDDVSPPPDAVVLQMDLQNLLMEGVRRMDERGRLAEVIPDLDAVVDVFGNRESLRQSLTLTPEEWRILFLIDGRRSVREVCQLAGNPDELASLQVLYRLLTGNLIGFGSARSGLKEALPPAVPPVSETTPVTRTPPPAVQEKAPAEAAGRKDAGVVSPEAVDYNSQTMALWARLLLKREGESRSFPLSRESQTLGRSDKNDIVIGDGVVSTFHARIDRTRDGFKIVDLRSTNGTFVNGARVTTVLLKPRDEIRVGAVRLVYLED